MRLAGVQDESDWSYRRKSNGGEGRSERGKRINRGWAVGEVSINGVEGLWRKSKAQLSSDTGRTGVERERR